MPLQVSALPVLLILPALVAAPSGERPAGPILYAPIDGHSIALTFDACPTSKEQHFDRAVFETLKRENVPATIFVSGRWAAAHPDAMTDLAASPLIEFGDHSWGHPHMRELAPAQMAREIESTEAVLARYGKHAVAFRPPYGEWSQQVMQVVHGLQLPVVLWDVVSGDPSAKISASGIVRNVLTRARPGSIIVFHINGRGWKTADAMPTVIAELRGRGFRFVHLSELLAGSRQPGTARRSTVVAKVNAAPTEAAPPAAASEEALTEAAAAPAPEPASDAFDPLVPSR